MLCVLRCDFSCCLDDVVYDGTCFSVRLFCFGALLIVLWHVGLCILPAVMLGCLICLDMVFCYSLFAIVVFCCFDLVLACCLLDVVVGWLFGGLVFGVWVLVVWLFCCLGSWVGLGGVLMYWCLVYSLGWVF